MKKNQNEIIIAFLIIGFSIALYFLYGILLSFIFGMLMAFSVNPVILSIQKVFKNKNISVSIFLIVNTCLIILFFMFCTKYINNDFKRLNQSFTLLAENNQENLSHTTKKAKEYITHFYDFEKQEGMSKKYSDSVITFLNNINYSKLDTESIKSSFEKIFSIFQSQKDDAEKADSRFSFIFILFSTIGYFILILYQIDYFIKIRTKYFGGKIKSIFHNIIDEFNSSFVKYLKLRTKIVLLLSLLYVTSFIILDIPGTILITLLIISLSYIPYFQYIALIPLSISCIVLSTENSPSFLFYFSIVSGVFILASIIEELLLNPRIMEKNIGMNPAIMVISISTWSYLLGIPGLLIGVPMTSLMIILFKHYFLQPYEDEHSQY